MDTARMSIPPATRSRTPLPVVALRAVIAGLAWWGLFSALHGDITQLRYFSQVTTLTVALTASAAVLGFAVRSTRWDAALASCRGASTTYAIVTAVGDKGYQGCTIISPTKKPPRRRTQRG